MLDRFKDEVHRLLDDDPQLESQRIRELLMEQGYEGGKTITDDYVREVRPYYLKPRSYQRTVYHPGELLQFDLWQPSREIPVGYGQTRAGYVVVGSASGRHRIMVRARATGRRWSRIAVQSGSAAAGRTSAVRTPVARPTGSGLRWAVGGWRWPGGRRTRWLLR
jgi:hypothetical protein